MGSEFRAVGQSRKEGQGTELVEHRTEGEREESVEREKARLRV